MSDPLGLDAEAMREMGHRTVDLLADLLADPGAGPALRRATPEEMAARVHGPPPASGEGWEELLHELGRDVLPFAGRCDHPGYFAFIPACGTWPGALGDFVASALNIYPTSAPATRRPRRRLGLRPASPPRATSELSPSWPESRLPRSTGSARARASSRCSRARASPAAGTATGISTRPMSSGAGGGLKDGSNNDEEQP